MKEEGGRRGKFFFPGGSEPKKKNNLEIPPTQWNMIELFINPLHKKKKTYFILAPQKNNVTRKGCHFWGQFKTGRSLIRTKKKSQQTMERGGE